MEPYLLSFHPVLEGDQNRLLDASVALGPVEERLVQNAAAVILPQVCRQDLYCLVKKYQKPCFPRPSLQMYLDGKVGNAALFQILDLPHPLTLVFSCLGEAVKAWQKGQVSGAGLRPPLVAKGAGGGEGTNVFLVHSAEDLKGLYNQLETRCGHGPDGLVLQQYVECKARDIRVVFIGEVFDCFWRLGQKDEFRANLSQGGKVDRAFRPEGLARATKLAKRFKQLAGLDLAAVDLILNQVGDPLLLEVNPYFGRKALGGGEIFLKLLLKGARKWLKKQGLEPGRLKPAC